MATNILVKQTPEDRRLLDEQLLDTIRKSLFNEDGLSRVLDIPDSEWDEALRLDELGKAARISKARGKDRGDDWPVLVSGDNYSNVMRLVHLAIRMVSDDSDRIRSDLLQTRRQAYLNELNHQIRNVGCDEQTGILTSGDTLSRFNETSATEATGIIGTYNYDVAQAIIKIRADIPTANRFTYASELRKWEAARLDWKASQVNMFTVGQARARAQLDFYRLNNIGGTARLTPETAKEPICQGWINRGDIPIREAIANPPPYHNFCPHSWDVSPVDKIPAGECQDLWVGE